MARDVADQIEKVRPWLERGMRGERPRPPPIGTTDLFGTDAEFLAAEREARERAARIP